MKSFSFGKALVLGSMFCFAVPIACGDDEPAKPSTSDGGEANGGSGATGNEGGGGTVQPTAGGDAGGAGGAATMLPPGLSETPKTIQCGGDCDSSFVGISPSMGVYIDPCCDADEACGLSTTFLAAVGVAFPAACQAHEQA